MTIDISGPPFRSSHSPPHSGEVQNFQDVVRGDIKTETITAKTSTYTVHSTTKYLFTSIQTYFTSVVTPVVTSTLKTATLFTDTVYTSTAVLTGFRAAELTETSRIITTKTILSRLTKTVVPTVTKALSIATSTRTLHPKTVVTSIVHAGTSTAKVTSVKTVYVTAVETLAPTLCSERKAAMTPISGAGANEKRKIVSTTTVTDSFGTYILTDYINTATDSRFETVVSTDYTDPALQTLSSTSTIFDPYGTQITSGIFYGVSTTILGS